MTNSEAPERFERQLLDINGAGPDERVRVRSTDGWVVITGREHELDPSEAAATGQQSGDANTQGLTVTWRLDIEKNLDSDSRQIRSLILDLTDDEWAAFRFACAEAARAEHELANPLIGLRHCRAALQSFPFLPGLGVLRDKLIGTASNLLQMSLQSAEECLRDRRTWAAARPTLERAKALLEAEDTLHVAFATRYELLQSLYVRLTRLSADRHKLAQADEYDLLLELRDELADDSESFWHMPGWRNVRARLNRLDAMSRQRVQDELFEARRKLVADVHRAYNDSSAGGFIERFVQNGDLPPHDEAVAQLQLEEAGTLIGRANQLLHTHEAVRQDEHNDFNTTIHSAAEFLHQEIDKLEGWQRDLRALISGMSLARHRAALGLHEPEQFDVARFVLGVGGRKPTTPLRQVPQMFVGHPSLLQCKSYVDDCAARRKSQERLFREISLCLRFDAATAPEQITGHEADDLVHTLRSHLQAGTAYPIEIAWDKLREMQRGEPDDACGLQKALVYHDSDDHNHEVMSLPAITAVLQRKVHQIHILRDWLQTFSAGALRKNFDFPGLANWEQERKEIETLRDSGPIGLTEAQARSRAAKSGNGDDTVQGLWPLGRMCAALSQSSMMAHMRHQLSMTDPDAMDVPLCAAAHAINHQRHELWLTHERHLHECDRLANDIALRIEHYAAAWDEFEHSYRALMGLSSLRRSRIAESVEWQAFQRAAKQFCGICPNYGVFQSKLQDVQGRFKLQPECLNGSYA